MGRFYQTASPQFIDFVEKPNLNLQMMQAQKNAESDAIKKQFQSSIDFQNKETYSHWQEQSDKLVANLNKEADDVVNQFIKDPYSQEALQNFNKLKQKAKTLYSSGDVGMMSKDYQSYLAEDKQWLENIKKEKDSKKKNNMIAQHNKWKAYTIEKTAMNPHSEDWNRESQNPYVDMRADLLSKIDVKSMKYNYDLLGNSHKVLYIDGKPVMPGANINKDNLKIQGSKGTYTDEQGQVHQVSVKDNKNLGFNPIIAGGKPMPFQFERINKQTKGYFQDEIINQAFYLMKNDDALMANLDQKYRLFGDKDEMIYNENGELISKYKDFNDYVNQKISEEAFAFADQYQKVTDIKETSEKIKDDYGIKSSIQGQKDAAAMNRLKQKQKGNKDLAVLKHKLKNTSPKGKGKGKSQTEKKDELSTTSVTTKNIKDMAKEIFGEKGVKKMEGDGFFTSLSKEFMKNNPFVNSIDVWKKMQDDPIMGQAALIKYMIPGLNPTIGLFNTIGGIGNMSEIDYLSSGSASTSGAIGDYMKLRTEKDILEQQGGKLSPEKQKEYDKIYSKVSAFAGGEEKVEDLTKKYIKLQQLSTQQIQGEIEDKALSLKKEGVVSEGIKNFFGLGEKSNKSKNIQEAKDEFIKSFNSAMTNSKSIQEKGITVNAGINLGDNNFLSKNFKNVIDNSILTGGFELYNPNFTPYNAQATKNENIGQAKIIQELISKNIPMSEITSKSVMFVGKDGKKYVKYTFDPSKLKENGITDIDFDYQTQKDGSVYSGNEVIVGIDQTQGVNVGNKEIEDLIKAYKQTGNGDFYDMAMSLQSNTYGNTLANGKDIEANYKSQLSEGGLTPINGKTIIPTQMTDINGITHTIYYGQAGNQFGYFDDGGNPITVNGQQVKTASDIAKVMNFNYSK